MWHSRGIVLTVFIAVCCVAADWPQWRGPTGDSRTTGDSYPTKWSNNEQVKWKVVLPGAGNSSPIVWKDQVILTASSGREHQTLHVLSYNRSNGKSLWETTFFASPSFAPFSQFPPERGHAAPSPCTDGNTIICLFGSGDLVALDLRGKPRWIRSLNIEYGPFRNEYGISASPVIHDGKVFIQIDHDAESYLLAADVITGKTLWRTIRNTEDNWSTPIIAKVADRTQVICLGTRRAISYDSNTGQALWTIDGFERLCSTTPIIHDHILYATSGPRGEVMALDLASMNDANTPKILWRSKRIGPFIPSPVLVDDHLLIPDDSGFLTSLDAKTGKEEWRERMGGRARPSPVAAGGVVYLTALDGSTIVFRVGKEIEVLAKNLIGEDVAASPALAYSNIFIRGDKHLWCIAGSQP